VASYYYFASTLPLLRPDGPLPYGVDDFLKRAAELVGAKDMKILNAAAQRQPQRNTFLNKWQEYQQMLRAELASQRSRRPLYKGEEVVRKEVAEYAIVEAVRAALECDDPLQAELMLLNLQWKILDELVGLQVFSIEALLAHLLKLQLLQRRSHFVQEKGNDEFSRIFTDLQGEIAKR
jgi:hypothetical protein